MRRTLRRSAQERPITSSRPTSSPSSGPARRRPSSPLRKVAEWTVVRKGCYQAVFEAPDFVDFQTSRHPQQNRSSGMPPGIRLKQATLSENPQNRTLRTLPHFFFCRTGRAARACGCAREKFGAKVRLTLRRSAQESPITSSRPTSSPSSGPARRRPSSPLRRVVGRTVVRKSWWQVGFEAPNFVDFQNSKESLGIPLGNP